MNQNTASSHSTAAAESLSLGSMPSPPPAPVNLDIIEIADPAIDPQQIMAEIQARIERRRAELGYDQRTFPTFGAAAYPGEPADIAYDKELHYYLRLANEIFAAADTDPLLAASPYTRTPVIGPLWQRIRAGAHNLVLFYVNRSIAHQTNVNSDIISVLNRLTVLAEDQQRTILRLQAEVERLRERQEP